MKNNIRILVAIALCLNLIPAHAQFGVPGNGMGGLNLAGPMGKLFSENPAFSASVEIQTVSLGETTTMPGKISFAQGKSRFEMDMTEAKGGQITPQTGAQMKAMGMDRMVVISRPDKKLTYMIYPGMEAYAGMPIKEAKTASTNDNSKVETTGLGKETVDNHACAKNKVVVTDQQGKKQEFTVWNATDLKNFPIKIEQTDARRVTTTLFTNVKFNKPEASLFDPPSDFKSYDSFQTMLQEVMMKRMGGALGAQPRP